MTRYSLYQVMFYRNNLLTHSKRVYWIIKEISPLALKTYGEEFNAHKTALLGLIHDDPEMIIGDIQSGNKMKMSAEELEQISQNELKAIDKLAKRFPKELDGYSYRDLLLEALGKETLEAQLVDFADKLDAFGEALHEMYGGNTVITENVVNQYGTIPVPFQQYIPYLTDFPNKFPMTKKLFTTTVSIFSPPEELDYKAIAKHSHPHTADSIRQKTGYLHYDFWREVTLKNASEEEIKKLHAQKEFL
ncbi:MAG: YfbR-like 5'-deoxynucleotidase [Patescibacteria group bacterium]